MSYHRCTKLEPKRQRINQGHKQAHPHALEFKFGAQEIVIHDAHVIHSISKCIGHAYDTHNSGLRLMLHKWHRPTLVLESCMLAIRQEYQK